MEQPDINGMDFAQQSRAGAALAVQVTADIQLLAERSVDLERSARQFLVLKEPALRERFAEAASALGLSLEELVAGNGKRRGRPSKAREE